MDDTQTQVSDGQITVSGTTVLFQGTVTDCDVKISEGTTDLQVAQDAAEAAHQKIDLYQGYKDKILAGE